jgi:ribosome-binding protein aMBF1 (putative translation factor)
MTDQADPAFTRMRDVRVAGEEPSVPTDEELDQLVAEMEDPSQWDQEDVLVGPGFYRSAEVAMQFAEFVTAFRADRGLSQKEFGRLIRVMEGDVAFMESGRYTPDVEMLVRFGRHLGLSLMVNVTPAGAALQVQTVTGREPGSNADDFAAE